MSELSSSQARIWLSDKESCFSVDVEKSFPPRKVFWNPYFVQEASKRQREVEKVEMKDQTIIKVFRREWSSKDSTLPVEERAYRLEVVGEFLKVGIPIGKIDTLRSMLEKKSYRLTGSSHLGQYVSTALKQGIGRIKQELGNAWSSWRDKGPCASLIHLITWETI